MKNYLPFLLILLAGPLFGQEPSAKRITQHIKRLASDKMQGRGTGNPKNAKAARYVEKYFKKYGLKPLGTDDYYQSFTAKVRRVVVPDSLRQAANVVGFPDYWN